MKQESQTSEGVNTIQITAMNRPNNNNKKPLLVFVNPKSGTGTALQLCKKQLEPKLKAEHIPYELIVTKFAGEAKSFLSKQEEHFAPSLKSRYSGFVCVSGDGLVFEVLNSRSRTA